MKASLLHRAALKSTSQIHAKFAKLKKLTPPNEQLSGADATVKNLFNSFIIEADPACTMELYYLILFH
jgi:hypothetical protein